MSCVGLEKTTDSFEVESRVEKGVFPVGEIRFKVVHSTEESSFKPLREVPVGHRSDHLIVPGISVTSSGQATVDPATADLLFDLALQLEEPTNRPVDVQHVLAAIVLAARQGELHSNTPLSSDDPVLIEMLVGYVKIVFEQFGGKVGEDD